MFDFFKKQDSIAPENIKDDVFFIYYDEVTRQIVEKYSQDLEYLCGRKGFSLVRISPFDIPIPNYFVISSNVFELIFAEHLKEMEDLSTDDLLRTEIPKVEIPEEVTVNILKYYSRLSGFTDAWVAIRPSIVLPKENDNVSFSGQIDTLLNVRGEEDLLNGIKKVYKSFWSNSVAKFLINHKIDISEVRMGLVIQKMVPSETAGIVFTVNPVTRDEDELMIEAVYGLGDTIADGLLTPDQYIVTKDEFEIKEKIVAPQEWMMIRDIPKKGKLNTEKKVEVSPAWQRKNKLEDVYIRELAELSTMLEKGIGRELEIEWAHSGGQLWILQTKDAIRYNIDQKDRGEKIEINPQVLDQLMRQLEHKRTKQGKKLKTLDVDTEKQAILTSGKTNGVKEKVEGRALIITSSLIKSHPELSEEIIEDDFIIITDQLNNKLIDFLPKVRAIISNEGAIGSDLAIEATAQNIPILTNTFVATWSFKNGEKLKVDGETGQVFLADGNLDEQIDRQRKREKDMVSKQLSNTEKSSDTPPQELEPEKDSTKESKNKEKKQPKEDAKKGEEQTHVMKTTDTVTDLLVNIEDYNETPEYIKSDGVDGVCSISLKRLLEILDTSPYWGFKSGNTQEYAQNLLDLIVPIFKESTPKPVVISLDLPQEEDFYKGLDKHPKKNNFSHPNEQILPQILKVLRRIHTVYKKRNIQLLIEEARSGVEVKEIRKKIKATGFRTSKFFKVGTSISYPSLVHDIETLLTVDIDFINIDIDKLTKALFATEELNLTNLSSNITISSIKDILQPSTKQKIRVYLRTSVDNFEIIQKLTKQYIKLGISGLVLDYELVKEYLKPLNNLIEQVESENILG